MTRNDCQRVRRETRRALDAHWRQHPQSESAVRDPLDVSACVAGWLDVSTVSIESGELLTREWNCTRAFQHAA